MNAKLEYAPLMKTGIVNCPTYWGGAGTIYRES